MIEIYLSDPNVERRGPFTVADTGGDVGAKHIDVFVGAITIAEADILGLRNSRVGIVQ